MHRVFLRSASPNPLESLERRHPGVRKNDPDRKFSIILAGRKRRSTPGRHRRPGSGAAWPGGIGGSNRKVEPHGVRPSSPVAQWVAHRMADWRRRAGKREGRKDPARSSAGFFVCFFLGASAGRGRRISGVDGANIGRGTCRVKEYYRKKGNIFGGRPGSRLFARESLWEGDSACAFPRGRPVCGRRETAAAAPVPAIRPASPASAAPS